MIVQKVLPELHVCVACSEKNLRTFETKHEIFRSRNSLNKPRSGVARQEISRLEEVWTVLKTEDFFGGERGNNIAATEIWCGAFDTEEKLMTFFIYLRPMLKWRVYWKSK